KNNNPVGLQVGVYHLVYFPDEYRLHFNAHNLVVYGKENNTYLISDPVMENVTTLTDKQLEKVRFAKGAFAPKGHIYYPVDSPKGVDIEQASVQGSKHTCQDMLAPSPVLGAKGIRYPARLSREWPKQEGRRGAEPDLPQLGRMRDESGTGGGGFRYIVGA